MGSIILTSKQKLALTQKYNEYLAAGPTPKNELTNSRNLFDDVNIIDKAIFYKVLDRMTQSAYHPLLSVC